MTNQFRELTERLAIGINHKDGTAILVTSGPEDDELKCFVNGNGTNIVLGIVGLIKGLLDDADDEQARMFRDIITQVLNEKMPGVEVRKV